MAENSYTVTRSTTVAAAPEQVYAEVEELRRWQGWSPWEDVDPNLQRSYSGPDRGLGSAYAWKGNRKAGEGHMRVIAAGAPRHVEVAVDFLKPFKSS